MRDCGSVTWLSHYLSKPSLSASIIVAHGDGAVGDTLFGLHPALIGKRGAALRVVVTVEIDDN
jgi:hypothetical protein